MKSRRIFTGIFSILTLIAACWAVREARSFRSSQRSLAMAALRQTQWETHLRDAKDRNAFVERHRAELQHTLDNLRASHPDPAAPNITDRREVMLRKEAYLTPQMQNLMLNSFRARLRLQYGPFYHSLGFTPAQIDSFEDLLTEHRGRQSDVWAAAATLGLNTDSPEISSLLASDKSQLASDESELLGPAAYSRLQDFVQSVPERMIVGELAESLLFTSSPLSAEQTSQLEQALRGASNLDSLSGTTSIDQIDWNKAAIDWDNVGAQAAAFLSPRQNAELASTLAGAETNQLVFRLMTMIRAWEKESPDNHPRK